MLLNLTSQFKEVASVLIAFDKHDVWQTKEIMIRLEDVNV